MVGWKVVEMEGEISEWHKTDRKVKYSKDKTIQCKGRNRDPTGRTHNTILVDS